MKERADWIEQRLFGALQSAVLRPEAIEYALGEFERQLSDSLSNLDNKIGRMRQRSDEIQAELRNLVTTVASCGPSPALVEAINIRELELKEITRQLLGTGSDSVSAHVAQAREFVTRRLGDIRQFLQADVQRAKAELAKHVSEINMIPQPNGKNGHYVAAGAWSKTSAFGWLRGTAMNAKS